MSLPRHGSAEDRGSADRYYGRNYDPHYYVCGSYMSDLVETDDMTDKEIAAYHKGWEKCTDRKYYGEVY